MNLVIVSIVVETALPVLSSPFLFYLTYKYHQFRYHFIISRRFPEISFILQILLAFTIVHLLLIEWLHYFDILPQILYYLNVCLSTMLSLMIGSFTFQRNYLTFVKWIVELQACLLFLDCFHLSPLFPKTQAIAKNNTAIL